MYEVGFQLILIPSFAPVSLAGLPNQTLFFFRGFLFCVCVICVLSSRRTVKLEFLRGFVVEEAEDLSIPSEIFQDGDIISQVFVLFLVTFG